MWVKPILIIFSLALLVQACNLHNAADISFSLAKADRPTIGGIDFEKEIKPILVKNCSPCHFPGGKMYGRLPFDKDTTIVNHSASILRRIKNDEENALIKEFVSQNKSGPSQNEPH
jgi:hypothetical protein